MLLQYDDFVALFEHVFKCPSFSVEGAEVTDVAGEAVDVPVLFRDKYGNRKFSHAARNIKSPCDSLTVSLFILSGQAAPGLPSHLIVTSN